MSVKGRRTGLAYDEKLTKHYSLWNPDFTEVPDRIIKPFQKCQEYNLIQRCHTVQCRNATQEEMLLLHTEKHLKTLKSSINMTEEELKQLSQKFDYIYFHNDSYASACLALGTSLQLVDDIIADKISNGFAIIRPPGHHAGREEFNGYCYFNNAAVCAQNAIQKHKLKRILIVDWDVHHGQGIQKFFYNDPRVLYFSIHRYEYRQEWPNLRESDYDFVGSEEGQGYNINVPLNEDGCTNSDYLFIFFNVLLPIAYQFDPELVIISAGFDCALGCPEGEMEVTPACFTHFINLLSPLAGGKLALLLEGGYCIESLSESVAMSVKALLGDVCPPLKPTQSPKDSVVESVLNIIKVLRPYWSCLRYQPLLAPGQKPKISTLVRLPSVSSVGSDPCEDGKVYPLIQECYDTSPDVEEKLGENMIRLERIIQSTVFRKTKHKLALVSSEDVESGDTSLVQDVFIKLKEMNMWEKCKHIKQANTSSKEEVKNLIDSILSNECQSGILFIRPPADVTADSSINGTSSSMLNSISTAAEFTRSKYKLKRVLFVDLTNKSSCKNQELFYDDKSILYISLNCCDSGDNGTTCISKTGDKSGEGYNINIAWRTKDVGNGDYIAAFYQVVLPVAYEFSPEMVFVVAGFDQVNRKGGEYSVSPACFGYMTRLLKGLADGKLFMAIESRENNEKITDSIVSCISVLLDNPCQSLGSLTPSQSGVESVCKVADELSPYWSSLQYREAIPELDAETIQSHINEDKKFTETTEDTK